MESTFKLRMVYFNAEVKKNVLIDLKWYDLNGFLKSFSNSLKCLVKFCDTSFSPFFLVNRCHTSTICLRTRFAKNKIIPLSINLVRSRQLDIGLIAFLRVYGHRKRELCWYTAIFTARLVNIPYIMRRNMKEKVGQQLAKCAICCNSV